MPKPYNPINPWTTKAKKEGYRARSVYKLQELDKKFHLFHPGMKVLDVGAAPGSWLQYISKKIGDSGLALGLDLQEIEPIAQNVVTKVCDFMHTNEVEKYIKELGWGNPRSGEAGVDIVVSDIMPNTTGIKIVDRQSSIELSRQVFEIAKKYLKPKGYLVMKVFDGEGFAQLTKEFKGHFSQVKIIKPQASRAQSKEVYVVCH